MELKSATTDLRVVSVKIPKTLYLEVRAFAGRSEQTNGEIVAKALELLLAEQNNEPVG